ncbi:Leucine-rich repeats and immunoglobulin-like domains protein 2 [Orchesella cincta]|uniref:Leucine-rich repeats and immunoglobulin-like domains protein 2 n=1 Tax=Orchesella cincta TaxID=48709 RepID=A0A1D2NF29_ORCCI|nr:Leucine-rich repeats and immunoglobulin-like domains protein 2 [Orchesella cincta]
MDKMTLLHILVRRPRSWSWRSEIMTSAFRIAVVSLLFNALSVSDAASGSEVTCPWYGDQGVPEEFKSSCVCAQNPPSSNQLSVQCHDVDGHQLVALLSQTAYNQRLSIGLLYLNASFITDDKGEVPEKIFHSLKLVSLQLSNCMIQSIHRNAFRGLESTLKHLSLTQNHLSEVPSSSVSNLANLLLLDLSFNKITVVEAGDFKNLQKLSTLKLNDNNIELDVQAFTGLEKTLKNLNLKGKSFILHAIHAFSLHLLIFPFQTLTGTRLSAVPLAITNLSSLAFLDLAQNRLRELDDRQFSQLHSLTALNLERNLLQSLPTTAFQGVNDTLSSLSLLNNLITYYPTNALRSLTELRVLDLGFNLLTEIPRDAFTGLKSLTLLALDGNPLTTLSEESFLPINGKGISLGGRFLNCDCRLRFIFSWMKEFDLQVTSRERNPQFCGSPSKFRTFNFQQINPDELVCLKNETTTTTKAEVAKEIKVPKEVTVLSIDTPMTVLEFENTTGSDETQNVSTANTQPPSSATEKPTVPITEYLNPSENSTNKFRFRRPRPRPRSTTAKPIFISSTEKFADPDDPPEQSPQAEESQVESVERNDAEEESKELEVPKNEKPVDEIQTGTKFVRPSPTRSIETSLPTSLAFSSTTKRYPAALKTLRSFQSKEAIQQTTSSATTSISVSSTTKSSTNDDVIKVPLIRAKPPTPMTITPKPVIINSRPSPAVVRKASIDTKDFDESKIPIISGVGPTRLNSETNNGNNNNVVPIKTPPPGSVQTQGVMVFQPPPGIQSSSSSMNNQAMGSPRSPSLIFADIKSDIVIRDIQRTTDSVMLRWESMGKQLAGYRIIYRLFGEEAFRHGPPLAPTEREYRIKHVPFNECIVVCVVPYDDILYNEISPSAGSVPPGSQCRELKPTTPSVLMNHMDKITIGASAAICATVIIAVLLFIAITRRAKGKRSPSASTLMSKVPPGMMTPSPAPGHPGINHGSMNLIKDWDSVSGRSIPRAKYHGSLDHLATGHRQSMIAVPSRPIPDGHSTHRSYLSAHHHHHNHSMHAYHGNAHHHGTIQHGNNNGHGFVHNRPIRMSVRSSHDVLNSKPYGGNGGHTHTSHRHFEPNHKRKRDRGGGRPSQSESLNTLSGYDTPDNWTDHDMDVYVARNHARHHDLVQL